MINLWNYANDLPKVIIRKKDGTVISGKTICVWDAEETGDMEDSIALDLDGGGVESVYQSEIQAIERI